MKDVLGGREPDEFTEQKIMAILVCRVAWMPGYRSDTEPAEGGGGYVVEGNVPHESLNFLPIDGIYYGFVHNHGNRINFDENDLGGQPADEKIADVSVVFCAEDPESGEFLVTGWYSDATVHRFPFGRPGDARGRNVYFTATEATLIGKAERCFGIPRAQDNPQNPFGVGQRHIWYGLNKDHARAAVLRDSLNNYMATQAVAQQTPEQTVVESRKRRISERLERRGTYRHFIREKGYQCEACGWEIEEDEVDVWGSSFELHHLTPLQELQEGDFWEVGIEDFAVLCASCHRAIHRTEYVSDVESFAQNYLPGRQGDDA